MIRILAFLLILLAPTTAFSQTGVTLYCPTGLVPPNQLAPCSTTNPLPTSTSGGGGLSVVDQTAFTYGVSPFTPGGGFYNSSITPLSSGQQGAFALTANRSLHTLDDNSAAWLASLGSPSDAVCATATGTCSEIALQKYNNSVNPILGAGSAVIGTVGSTSQYPVGAVPITASATGTTGATTATLAGTSGKTTYICGYSIRANANAAATVTDTITGVITATLSSILWVAPAASGIGVDEQIFLPCIPASATNTGIAIVSGAPGTGGVVSSKGWGYQL